MCSMKTDAMNRRDITNTGTGPLKKSNNNRYMKIARSGKELKKNVQNTLNQNKMNVQVISLRSYNITVKTNRTIPTLVCEIYRRVNIITICVKESMY